MISIIKVCDRNSIMSILDQEGMWFIDVSRRVNWALISINSDSLVVLNKRRASRLALRKRCVGAISLVFSDVSDSDKISEADMKKYKLKLFSDDQALQVVKFVDEVKEKATLLVAHCDAGISRSGAVGSWASDYLGLEYGQFKEWNPHLLPNAHVYRTLARMSGMRDFGLAGKDIEEREAKKKNFKFNGRIWFAD